MQPIKRARTIMAGLVAIGLAPAVMAQTAGKAAAPPAPPAAPRPVIVALPPPAPAPPDFGDAPQAAPAASFPLDPKAAKAARKARTADAAQCLEAKEELKDWMAKGKREACDRLLALAPDPQDPWDWRARVLQQRAVALTVQGDQRHALAALDEGDAIGKAGADPLFDLGLGLGNTMLRAWVLGRQGKKDEALALLGQARATRPWAPSVVQLADLLETALAGGDAKVVSRQMAARFRIDPDVARSLIYLYVMQGELDAAAAFGDRVSLVDPRLRGGWSLDGSSSPAEELRDRVRMDAVKAYVATAQGQAARAQALNDGARAAIAAYIGTDPRLAGSKAQPSKRDVKNYEERAVTGAGVMAMLDEWVAVGAQRQGVAALSLDDFMRSFEKFQNKADLFPAMIEQLRLFGASKPAPEGVQAKAAADAFLARTILSTMTVRAGDLGRRLPRAETLDQVPKLASTASKWLFSDGSGYSQAKEGDGTVRTVRYESLVASREMVEELLLLAVAMYARAEGKDGFVVLSNRTINRRTTMYGWYGGGNTYDSGVEAQARVMLVNTAALPPELAGQADRVIPVAEVERDVKPRYDALIARKEALAAAKKAARQ